jgi:hypothetical protein
MKKFIFLSVISIFIFAQCKNNAKQIDENIAVIHCLNCTKTLSFAENNTLFPNVEYLQLETTDDCLIDEIKQVEVMDTNIFVLNNSENLYIFSKNSGNFVNQIGKKGQGPGEYLSIRGFFVDRKGKTLSLIDLWGKKVIKYDLDGTFIETKNISAGRGFEELAMCADNGNILFYNLFGKLSTTAYSAYKVENDSIENIIPYGNFKIITAYVPFSRHPMTYSNEGIDFIMPLDNLIYQYKDDKVNNRYQLEFSGKAPNIKMVSESDNPIVSSTWKLAFENVFPGFTAIYETPDKLLLNSYNNKGGMAYFIADKNKLAGSYYDYAFSPQSINPVFGIIGASEDVFISQLEAPQLVQWREEYKDLTKIPDIRLREIIQNVQFEDNPCLVFYH